MDRLKRLGQRVTPYIPTAQFGDSRKIMSSLKSFKNYVKDHSGNFRGENGAFKQPGDRPYLNARQALINALVGSNAPVASVVEPAVQRNANAVQRNANAVQRNANARGEGAGVGLQGGRRKRSTRKHRSTRKRSTRKHRSTRRR